MNNIKQIRNRTLREANSGDNIDDYTCSSKIKYLKLLKPKLFTYFFNPFYTWARNYNASLNLRKT